MVVIRGKESLTCLPLYDQVQRRTGITEEVDFTGGCQTSAI